MVPWPIALLCGFYTAVAMCAASAAWKGVHSSGLAAVSLPIAWVAASAVVVGGLAYMKPWSRTLAVWVSTALLLSALMTAIWSVVQSPPQPSRSLIATGLAGVYLVAIRYLTRPRVRAWFTPVPGTGVPGTLGTGS